MGHRIGDISQCLHWIQLHYYSLFTFSLQLLYVRTGPNILKSDGRLEPLGPATSTLKTEYAKP